jgi:hypothetical protein
MTIYKRSLSELKDLAQSFDLFICSGSFEERCLSIARNVDKDKIGHSFIFYSNDRSEIDFLIGNNVSILKQLLGEHTTEVIISRINSLFTTDTTYLTLDTHIKKYQTKSILFDITTFTHESLLILLFLLNVNWKDIDITCIYASASTYNHENDTDNKWLSLGITGVHSVVGYPGNLIPTQETHLIIVVGYEVGRTMDIINYLEPNYLTLLYVGSENAITDLDREANKHYTRLLTEMSPSYVNPEAIEIDCSDPFKTCESLSHHIEMIIDRNILLVPMNNKISTVGVALAAIKHNDVQVCHAPALLYNYQDYSVPGSDYYIFSFPKDI